MFRVLAPALLLLLSSCTLLVRSVGPVRCDENTFFRTCEGDTLVFCDEGFENREFCGDNGVCDINTLTCNRCGDGILLFNAEQCDDANDVDGDGCSATCIFEFCGDGIINNFGEECDDTNNLSGDGCGANCRLEVCGDGIINIAGEQCDDNNNASGDGCSSDCLFEGSFEFEPNNIAQQANGPLSPEFFIQGAITPVGDVDFYEVVLTEATSLRIETFDLNGVGSCTGIDTRLKLFDANISLLADDDDSGVQNCALLDRHNTSAVLNMQPGIYFVSVTHFNNTSVIAGYTLAVTREGICGNGVTEIGEECDDANLTGSDGCSTICSLEICGDGVLQGAEQCDDANVLSGDGCSAFCTLEGCGNGIVEGVEQCDDANLEPFDGCKPDCTLTCDPLDSDAFFVSAAQSSCYLQFNTLKPWQAAENDCIARGGHLVGISSPSEFSEVINMLNSNGTWIGLNDISFEAGVTDTLFSNSNREPNLFDNFGASFPVNGSTLEDCTLVDSNSLAWFNLSCVEQFASLCEIQIASCGNGRLDVGETCDDGNFINGDGCDTFCQQSLVSLPFFEDAEDASTPFSFTSNSALVGWQLDRNRAIGSKSLYMGNPQLRDYNDIGVNNVVTTLVTPPFVIPVGQSIRVDFSNIRLTENVTGFDTLDLLVRQQGFQDTQIQNISAFNGNNFTGVTVFVPDSFGGQPIQLVLRFATGDQTANGTEGIYLDNFSIQVP